MKFFLESSFVCILGLALASVNAQTGNYLINSYDDTMELLELFNYEVNYYRNELTWESRDMGYYFTDSMAEAIRVANTDYQGEGLQRCAEIAAASCETNIIWFEDQLRELEKDTRELHLSVYKILGDVNIIQEGGDMVYYNHDLYLDEMYYRLVDHDYNLLFAWLELFFRWFDVNDELDYCTDAVILPRE